MAEPMTRAELVETLWKIVTYHPWDCDAPNWMAEGSHLCGECPPCVARALIACVQAEPEPKVLTEGWARLCHDDDRPRACHAYGPHKPEWEFFSFQAERAQRVRIVEAE